MLGGSIGCSLGDLAPGLGHGHDIALQRKSKSLFT